MFCFFNTEDNLFWNNSFDHLDAINKIPNRNSYKKIIIIIKNLSNTTYYEGAICLFTFFAKIYFCILSQIRAVVTECFSRCTYDFLILLKQTSKQTYKMVMDIC